MALGTQHWYHITYAKNIGGIAAKGLRRNARPNWQHGGYDIHSQQGIFVTQPRLISYWIERFENMAEHNSDNIYKDRLIPIILRFTLHEKRLTPDKMANPEDRVYGANRIPPDRIEMWTGKEWRPQITLSGMKASEFLDKDQYGYSFKYKYPLPPEAQ